MASAGQGQPPSAEVFDSYFRRADADRDGRISGQEAVAFFQGSNLPKPVLAQIWTYADQNRIGFLGRAEFYNALKLVTVAQSGRQLTPDIVKAALYGPAAARIPPPQINSVPSSVAQMNALPATSSQFNSIAPSSSQMGVIASSSTQSLGIRASQAISSLGMNQQFFPSPGNNLMRTPQANTPSPSPSPSPSVTPSPSLTLSSSLPTQGTNTGLSGVGAVAGPHAPDSQTGTVLTDWNLTKTSGASIGGISQGSIRSVTPSRNEDAFGAVSGTAPAVSSKLQTQSLLSSSAPLKPLTSVLSSSQPEAGNSKSSLVSGNGFSSGSVVDTGAFTVTSPSKSDASAPSFSLSTMANSSGNASVAVGTPNSIKMNQLDSLYSSAVPPQRSDQLQQTQSLVKQNQLDVIQGTSANISVEPGISSAHQSQLNWPKVTQSDIQKYTRVFMEVDKDRDGKITGDEARNLFLSWRLPREILRQVWNLSDQDNDSMLSLREFCTALYLMERYREGRPLPDVLPNTLKFDEILLRATTQQSTAYGGPAWQPNTGLPHQGIPGSRPPLPTGARPPVQSPFTVQTDGLGHLVQHKSRIPGLNRQLVNQLDKEEQSALNTKLQGTVVAENKVQEMEKEILDSREKIEFYHTKMQELVLYKSRCVNKLNEIMERASADKREAESLGKIYEEKYKQVGELASKLTVEDAAYRDVKERKMELDNAIVKMEQGGSADGLLQVRADRIQNDLEDLTKALNERCKLYGLHVKPTGMIELPFGWQPGIQDDAAVWDEDWDEFEDEGFAVAKDLTIEVEKVAAPVKPMSPSAWSDIGSEEEFSHISSSNFTSKNKKPFSNGERVTEGGLAYDQSEEDSARSPSGSPRRSSLESPSKESQSMQFGIHDISPHAKSDHAESSISGDKFADQGAWSFDDNDDVDSVWGFGSTQEKETSYDRSRRNSLFDSGDYGLNPIKVYSPSASSTFGKENKHSFFEDSVPSTPQFNSGSSPKFNEGTEDHSFNSFSRFDSFSTHDDGFFPQHESLTRFDSIRSTAEFDQRQSDRFARFDSMRSTTGFDTRGSPSFHDADPFGSSGPFKSSENHSPKRGSDGWSAF